MAGLDDPVDLVVRSHFHLALVRPSGIESHIVLESIVHHNQIEKEYEVLLGSPTSPAQ